jgi:hypothetical protein
MRFENCFVVGVLDDLPAADAALVVAGEREDGTGGPVGLTEAGTDVGGAGPPTSSTTPTVRLAQAYPSAIKAALVSLRARTCRSEESFRLE